MLYLIVTLILASIFWLVLWACARADASTLARRCGDLERALRRCEEELVRDGRGLTYWYDRCLVAEQDASYAATRAWAQRAAALEAQVRQLEAAWELRDAGGCRGK